MPTSDQPGAPAAPRRAYLDHAATTPMVPEAIEAMTALLANAGNPSSLHSSGRAARRVVEEAREVIAQALGARPSEIVLTSGGTEADNLAVKGLFWARRAADPRRVRVLVGAAEHHAVLDSVEWLERHEGARAVWLDVDEYGRVHPETVRAAIEEDPDSVALVTVMWANNEVGTVSPISQIARVAHEFGVPVHSDAVQAVGQLPVDFAATGLDALSVTAHKLGGPLGVGALVLSRELAPTPVLHGGGQERDVRSGTLDAPAIAGFSVALHVTVERRAQLAAALGELRDDLVQRVQAAIPDAVLNGDPESGPDHRLPGNAHFAFPGCEGDALLMLLDARGVECSTGSACTAGVARPSHVLLAMGTDEESARSTLRFSLGHTSTAGRRRRPARRLARGRRAGAPGRAGLGSSQVGVAVQVLAAMSGGVDSAVAAARAVDAGHDVTGVHLALAKSPASHRTGARGCCTVEDARDARRAADVLGIPFYVWDLAERFDEDVVRDFVSEYAAGRTPNPCLRCNERIKFAAVLDKALALGFDAVCTGHYARLVDGAHGRELHRAVDPAKDQSYVLGVLEADQLAHAMFPLGPSLKADVRAEAAARGLALADKPDSHDVCFVPDGDTAGFLRRALDERGDASGDIVDADGNRVGSHEGVYAFTVGQRRGLRIGTPAPDGRPRYVLDVSPVTRTVTVGTAAELDVRAMTGLRPRWCGAAPAGLAEWVPLECSVQLRAHGEALPAVVRLDGDCLDVALLTPARGIAPGQAVVVYAGTRVVGSATIDRTRR